jgi:hypothetical protein
MANRMFTSWFTSVVDGLDHAVTDEEFADHRPEPAAVCGIVLLLAPLTSPNGRRCTQCVWFLRTHAAPRREPDRRADPSLVVRLLRRSTPTPTDYHVEHLVNIVIQHA